MVPVNSHPAVGLAIIVALVFQMFAGKLAGTAPNEDADAETRATPSEDVWDCAGNSRDCSLPATVNYRVPNMEYAINFDCSRPPFSNEHSQKLFRKVFSYRLDGRSLCSDIGIGLQYLHFPRNVTLLGLDGYCVHALPPSTFRQFDNLKRLEINTCRIEHLAWVSLRELLSLEELLLENSEFGTMESDTVDVLAQLRWLRVRNCTGIDFSIRALEQLHVVELEENMVKNISRIFDSIPPMLQAITAIGLMSDETPSIVLAPAVGNDSELHQISIVECFLTRTSVRNFPELVSLNLSQNLLNENAIELHNLPVLQRLIVSHNIFKLVPAALFGAGPLLDMIDLSHNHLSYIELEPFSMAPSVTTLDLSHNAFLNLGDFVPWPKLAHIRVDANPWDCLWVQHSRRAKPVLFETFKYYKRFDVLAIFGLPCTLQGAAEDISTASSGEPGDTVHDVIPTLPTRGHPQGEIIDRGPKTTVIEPLRAVARPLAIVITIAFGILISHVIILLYNRYRQLQHIPFYRHLARDRSVFDTITEKSMSFLYEAPVSSDQDAIPMNNIYEEIPEMEPFEPCVVYDALNFHRQELQQIYDRNNSNEAVYV